jgi:hypothetical protein
VLVALAAVNLFVSAGFPEIASAAAVSSRPAAERVQTEG